MQDDNTTTPRCLDAVAYPVTFEVGELLTEHGQRRFQARCRFDTMVILTILTFTGILKQAPGLIAPGSDFNSSRPASGR